VNNVETVYPAAMETVKFSESKDGWKIAFPFFASLGKKKRRRYAFEPQRICEIR
jgi:hypothetical protein